ncbi:MAG TPA: LysM domain-containing protein [Aggregatilinea sp.]|uniref:LysM peptidoglycan-binding domain-containing protein n=1 Tax=Aggregatilinea sp. TaxID=2806333 RepID=UPI002C6E2D1F|nr:LysM domain-containing protein [Aggregatilinea sp.]HML20205.1 LysM domain-containing protein [Aggregatilinea sp.]
MSERKPTQLCTICGSMQPLSARRCGICGATLSGQPATRLPASTPGSEAPRRSPAAEYDPALGDDDLYAVELAGRIWRLVLLGIVVVLIAVGGGVVLLLDPFGGDQTPIGVEPLASETTALPTAPPTATPRSSADAAAAATAAATPTVAQFSTATPGMAMNFPTVTPAPPTPTDSPTPGPCMQTAQSGDTIYAMASRCGHRDLSIVDLILEMNDMNSPEELQVGQELEIPWPTATPGGPTEDASGSGGAAEGGETSAEVGAADTVVSEDLGTPSNLATYEAMEPTLRPGLAWHTVQQGEDILTIAQEYNTTLETLSKINPEVAFLQCDYSSPSGGELCSVIIGIGQQIRVPVPLPTTTWTPTPVGTLTPTPTATATFNAPYLVSPADEALFNADQIVTLRWGGTGSLGPDERYVVRVRDLETGTEYVATVKETAYILPGGWQPKDRQTHEFEWSVSVGTIDAQNQISNENHPADPRTFRWDSR